MKMPNANNSKVLSNPGTIYKFSDFIKEKAKFLNQGKNFWASAFFERVETEEDENCKLWLDLKILNMELEGVTSYVACFTNIV